MAKREKPIETGPAWTQDEMRYVQVQAEMLGLRTAHTAAGRRVEEAKQALERERKRCKSALNDLRRAGQQWVDLCRDDGGKGDAIKERWLKLQAESGVNAEP